MRSHWTINRISQVLLLVLVSLATATTAQAAVTDAQVDHLVEALRDVAKQSSSKPKTLHSEWMISEINIAPWSKKCLQKEMTIEQFDRDSEAVGKIVSCVIKDNLETEYSAADNDEALAIRRVAAWWLTGDSSKYQQPNAMAYGDRILKAYQRRNDGKPFATQPLGMPTAIKPAEVPGETVPVEVKPEVNPVLTPEVKPDDKPEVRPGGTKKQIGPIVSVNAGRSTVYDRYMLTGNRAQQAKDYKKALLFFRRALDERPNDTYATMAIQEVESK